MSFDAISHSGLTSRRALMIAAAASVLGAGLGRAQPAIGPVAVLDYGLASTMLALGVAPAAIAALADWNKWMVEPRMPAGVVDLGTTAEINLEVLASVKPDLILSTPFLSALRPRLEAIAPVMEFTIYADGGDALSRSVTATREMSALIGRERQAADFLDRSERFFDGCAARVTRLAPPPLALVNFLDQRHVRIYGGSGLYQSVMTRIGLRNAWTMPVNYWGFETIGIERLGALDPDLRLMALEPISPPDLLKRMEDSPLWTSLPFIRARRVTVLPAVLSFGMVQEATRFAGLLLDRLERSE